MTVAPPWPAADVFEFLSTCDPDQSWANDCGMLAAMAHGFEASGWETAADQGASIQAAGQLQRVQASAQPGDIHFWAEQGSWTGGDGHVATQAATAGQIWSNDIVVTGQVNQVAIGTPATDWGLVYMGWASATASATWANSVGTNPYWQPSSSTPVTTTEGGGTVTGTLSFPVKGYDAVTAGNIPGGVSNAILFYYVDGAYANKSAIEARDPGNVYVPITIGNTSANTLGVGAVLDVESGDATAADAVQWCLAYSGSNRDLVVYANTSTWPSVQAAFVAAGVTQPNWWAANYSSSDAVPSGAIGIQYASTSYDESQIDSWPGVAEKTTTPPPVVVTPPPVVKTPPPVTIPPAVKEPDMLILAVSRTIPTGSTWPGDFLLGSDGSLHHIVDEADLAVFVAAGLKTVNVSYAQYASFLADEATEAAEAKA